MKLSQFNFELPEERLAEYPADHRDESRLMVLDRKTGTDPYKLIRKIEDLQIEKNRLLFVPEFVIPD